MSKSKAQTLNLQKFRPLLVPGLIIVLVLTSGLILVRPKVSQIWATQRRLKKEEKKLAKLTVKAAALQGLDPGELASKVEVTSRVLLSEKNLPLVLAVIKNLAVKNQLEVEEIKVDPGEIALGTGKTKGKQLSFLSFRVVLIGEMTNLEQFLTKAQKTAPLLMIREMKIDLSRDQRKLKAILALEVPLLPLPSELGSLETPLAAITPREDQIYQELTGFDFSLVKQSFSTTPSGKENPFLP